MCRGDFCYLYRRPAFLHVCHVVAADKAIAITSDVKDRHVTGSELSLDGRLKRGAYSAGDYFGAYFRH